MIVKFHCNTCIYNMHDLYTNYVHVTVYVVVQQNSSEAHSGKFSGLALKESSPIITSKHIPLARSLRLRSSFLSKLSIIRLISCDLQRSLCLINLFFPLEGGCSLSLPLLSACRSIVRGSMSDSSEDIFSAFRTGLIFSLVASSNIFELFNTLRRAWAFCSKVVIIK